MSSAVPQNVPFQIKGSFCVHGKMIWTWGTLYVKRNPNKISYWMHDIHTLLPRNLTTAHLSVHHNRHWAFPNSSSPKYHYWNLKKSKNQHRIPSYSQWCHRNTEFYFKKKKKSMQAARFSKMYSVDPRFLDLSELR